MFPRDRLVEQQREPLPLVAAMLEEIRSYTPAHPGFPVAHWQGLRWNNPSERLKKGTAGAQTWWAPSPAGDTSSAGGSWPGSMTWNNTAGSALHPDHRAVRTLVLGNNLDPGLVPVGGHLRQSHGNGGGQRPGGASLCPLGIRRPQLPHRCSSAAPTGPAEIVDAEHIAMSTSLTFLGCSSAEQSAGTRLAPLTSRPLLAHINIDVTMLLYQCNQ